MLTGQELNAVAGVLGIGILAALAIGKEVGANQDTRRQALNRTGRQAVTQAQTVTDRVLRTNEKGIQLQALGWANYSQYAKAADIQEPEEGDLVVITYDPPKAEGGRPFIRTCQLLAPPEPEPEPAPPARRAAPPAIGPTPPPQAPSDDKQRAAASMAPHDYLMARMSALKHATRLAVADGDPSPEHTAALAEYLLSWLYATPK